MVIKQKTIEVPVALSTEPILTELKKCYPQYFQSNNFSKELAIICDFREPQQSSDLMGLSFIITDLESLEPFRQLRLQVKEKYNLGNQEIKYSKFRASKRRPDYINSFLNVADEVEGIMCTFVIAPTLDELIPEYYFKFTERYPLYKEIHPKVFRKLNLLAHLISILLLPQLSKKRVINLISDQDDIFINHDIRDLSLAYITKTIEAYSSKQEFKFVFRDPEHDSKDRYLRDLSSIPDLAVGCLIDLFNSFKGNYDDFRKGGQWFPDDVKEKAVSYSEWLFVKDKALRRTSFFVELKPKENIEGILEEMILFCPLIPIDGNSN